MSRLYEYRSRHGKLLRAACVGALPQISGYGHEHHDIPNMADQPVHWNADRIARVMTFGFRDVGQVLTLDGRKCLEGPFFSFDFDDRYAFDIDEHVELEVEFYQHREAATPEVRYEKNGEGEEWSGVCLRRREDLLETLRSPRNRSAPQGCHGESHAPETGDAEETGTRETAVTLWDGQKDLLKQRIDAVLPIYDGLVARAASEVGKR